MSKSPIKLIEEWCEAQAVYDRENFPGGMPKYVTARRLYLAGRELYKLTGIEAATGRYERSSANNSWWINPPDRVKVLIDEG
jgi:hypothetical protein